MIELFQGKNDNKILKNVVELELLLKKNQTENIIRYILF